MLNLPPFTQPEPLPPDAARAALKRNRQTTGVRINMTVDAQTIDKLAELARIAISEETMAEVGNRLGEVLQLVDQLQTVNTEGVVPMAHPLDAVQQLRADVVTEPDRRQEFLKLAPQAEQGLYLVPKVID